eukprot:217995_1
MNKDNNDKKYKQISGTNMVLTTGASHSMELLLVHLKRLKHKTNPNCKNIVLCADPSYFLFPNIVDTASCKLLPIPMKKNHSLDFNYLEKTLSQYCNDIICFYIIPNHQNPLGVSYSLENKIKLLSICHKYKLHLISDEVYNLLSFDNDRIMIPFLSSIEQTIYSKIKDINSEKKQEEKHSVSSIDQIMNFGSKNKTETPSEDFFCHSISSLSKIIGPGFRLGWIMTANEAVLERLQNHGSFLSGGNMTQMVPSLLSYLFDPNDEKDYMTKHLMNVRSVLRKNCKGLCDTIRKYDKNGLVKFNEPKGGYFMWLELPMDKMKFIEDKNAKVKYFSGNRLSSTFGPVSKDIQFMEDKNIDEKRKYFGKCVRFCFAWLSEKEICDGARVFVQSIYD